MIVLICLAPTAAVPLSCTVINEHKRFTREFYFGFPARVSSGNAPCREYKRNLRLGYQVPVISRCDDEMIFFTETNKSCVVLKTVKKSIRTDI